MTPKDYKDNFFSHHLQMSISSAEEIIPIVLEYISPTSVIDIGCGVGTWLTVWQKKGINILGVDGDYVRTEELLIDPSKFIAANLENGYQTENKFDLVTCLEVAEHINPASADRLITSLCTMSNLILFSAAIPGQEGTLHVNEQYPTYWAKMFEKYNYVPVDFLRKRIWSNEKVSFWYRQNILLYVNQNVLTQFEQLQWEANQTSLKFLDLVHPGYFDYKTQKALEYEKLLNSPRQMISHAIKKISNKK